MSDLIGHTLGRYQIRAEIGRGGMGVVYRATDTMLSRDVALKVLPAALVADPDRKRRFLQEARTASSLEHPHIGVIHEVGEADGVTFIAMELIRGERLADVLASGLTPVRAVELATEIAEGLARAHDKGIVHRDLKPANVMVTEDGHAKIIDFGLAKLIENAPGSDAETVQGTHPGMVMGTANYMSPEQARAGKIDHRSDIFSFGVMLYEMLAGRLPFSGQSSVDTMHAIMHAPAPPLPAIGGDVTADLQRVIEKSLAKDPDARYQGMRDLVVDLRAARRRLESGATIVTAAPAMPAQRSRTGLAAAIGAVVLAGVAVAAYVWWPRHQPAPPVADGGKPTIAVLYFQNNTGNQQLDWLRAGLTEMMVTDLSQNADLDVLGTDRLVQIFRDLHKSNDDAASFETVQEVARRAGVKHVLVGSYLKAGDTIRINVTLQEAGTGKILTADRVDAAGEANLFATVDDLTRRVKAKFSIATPLSAGKALLPAPGTSGAAGAAGFFRNLSDVTTASPEAFRYFAEGTDVSVRGKYAEAIPLFEKAIAIDPNFAMALSRLAIAEGNTGHIQERATYAARALALSSRLTPREKAYVEGVFYSTSDDTVDKAIAAYTELTALSPNDYNARHNLCFLRSRLEQFDQAIAICSELVSRPSSAAATHVTLATVYARTGQLDEAQQVYERFIAANPSSVLGYRRLATLLTIRNRLDEARDTFAKADAIDGGAPPSNDGRLVIDVLQERWADADAELEKLRRFKDPVWQLGAAFDGAGLALSHGHPKAVFDLPARAASIPGLANAQRAAAFGFAGDTHLRLGDAASAAADGQRAIEFGTGAVDGRLGYFVLARAQDQLGRRAEAQASLASLQALADKLPGNRDKRLASYLQGVLALDRKEFPEAIRLLTGTESLLPKGITLDNPAHVALWYDLAMAYLGAQDDEHAAVWFRRIVDSPERFLGPIEFVRSIYFLAQIADRRGDHATAVQGYQRFLLYWGSGEIDRDKIADARKHVGG